MDDDDLFDDSDDYRRAQRHNMVWDEEEDEIITDMEDLHTFIPAEEWETEYEDNFMGGRPEDYEEETEEETIQDFIIDKVIDFSDNIIKESKRIIRDLELGRMNPRAFNSDLASSFMIDELDNNSGWIKLIYEDVVIEIGTPKSIGYYTYVKYNSNNSKQSKIIKCNGELDYRKFNTDGKNMFSAFIEHLLDDFTYQEKRKHVSYYINMLNKSEDALMSMEKAYRAVIKLRMILQTMVNKY